MAYLKRNAQNEGLVELMKRLPEHAVKRDVLADPAVQADANRDVMRSMGQGGDQFHDTLGALSKFSHAKAVKQAFMGQLLRGGMHQVQSFAKGPMLGVAKGVAKKMGPTLGPSLAGTAPPPQPQIAKAAGEKMVGPGNATTINPAHTSMFKGLAGPKSPLGPGSQVDNWMRGSPKLTAKTAPGGNWLGSGSGGTPSQAVSSLLHSSKSSIGQDQSNIFQSQAACMTPGTSHTSQPLTTNDVHIEDADGGTATASQLMGQRELIPARAAWREPFAAQGGDPRMNYEQSQSHMLYDDGMNRELPRISSLPAAYSADIPSKLPTGVGPMLKQNAAEWAAGLANKTAGILEGGPSVSTNPTPGRPVAGVGRSAPRLRAAGGGSPRVMGMPPATPPAPTYSGYSAATPTPQPAAGRRGTPQPATSGPFGLPPARGELRDLPPSPASQSSVGNRMVPQPVRQDPAAGIRPWVVTGPTRTWCSTCRRPCSCSSAA